MEKLKVVLMAGLFWTFIIWFARTMKRKSKEQYKKQEERMPEMESVTEEERCYICEKLVDYTEAKNVFWWIMIFLNLFFVIIWAGKTINVGINGEAFSLFSNICMLSLFIGITYLCHSMRTYLIEEKRLYEKGELKKKIVQVKKCGSSSQGGSYGVIEERNTVNTINITFRGDERKVYRYDRMAMLVEREDMQFFLIPTMEAERDSDQEENSDR